MGVVFKWTSVSYKMHKRLCALLLFGDRALAWHGQGTRLHVWHWGLGKVSRLIFLSDWGVMISFPVSDNSKLQEGHTWEAVVRP